MALTFRRAVLADRTWMRSMLVTKVAGVSPLDELVADWGASVESMTAADLLTGIQSGQYQVAVALDAGAGRGWNVFWHHDDLTRLGVPDVPDAWQSLYTITDKHLPADDRLAVFAGFMAWGANLVAPTTYVYGQVVAGRRLDTYLSTRFASVPSTVNGVAVNVYYATAGDVKVRV